jgi:hypothetical protein
MSTPRASRRPTGNDERGVRYPEIRAAPPSVTSQAHSRTAAGLEREMMCAHPQGRVWPAQPSTTLLTLLQLLAALPARC